MLRAELISTARRRATADAVMALVERLDGNAHPAAYARFYGVSSSTASRDFAAVRSVYGQDPGTLLERRAMESLF